MSKLSACLLLCLGCYLNTAAQTVFKGKVMDTLEKKPVVHAVIALLQKKDSTLAHFTRTDKTGAFSITAAPGRYIMLVSFPKLADFAEEVELKENEETVFGNVAMTHKSELLKEVIVRSGAAIRIKGDTTEFTADSFAVREGATVEELLKKMPGFQVNSKGEITAQGQRVEKVLVDGEEFFGDDPTMATQNIAAKAVDKVQVYETKSDQQQVTGISSGTGGKTVNIKLKEDHKKGGFGKAHAGTDFKDYFDGKAFYNRFTGKRKVSVYGTKSNISTGSLNWEDQQKLGMQEDFEYDEINGYYFSFGGSDEFSEWNLRGLPNSYTAGALYSNKWNGDRTGLNTSYRFNRLGTVNEHQRNIQSILENNINYRNTLTRSNGFNQQHAVNAKYEWKIDSLATLKFTTVGQYKTSETASQTSSEYLNRFRQAINTSEQQRINSTERLQSDNQLQYKQLFTKKNRILLATLRYGLTRDDQEGTNVTQTRFYANDSLDLIDQLRMISGESRTLGTKVTFSEPLSLKWNLVLDYSYNRNAATSHRNTFNKDNNGKYVVLDTVFSNNFDLDVDAHSGTALFRYMGKKLNGAFGTGLSNVVLQLNDLDAKVRNTYDFFRITPQAQFRYTPKTQMNLTFNYRGTTRQPTIDQLQPIRDNSDNLNIFVGNPDLKVGFNHNLRLSFNQYKVLSGKSIYLSLSYNIYNNAITNYTYVDTARGTQVYTPINVNGNRNWNYYTEWSKGQGEKKLHFGIHSNGFGGRNNNFINQKGVVSRNQTDYYTFNGGLSMYYEESEKVSLQLRPTVGYNISQSSLQPSVNNNYFTYGGNFSGFLKLPGQLELTSNADFQLRQRLPAFPDNLNQIIWGATLGRKLLKDKSGRVMLVANDILNQNRGFNRTINSNFIQEERYSSIGRYFLLKFEWTFNKMAGGK